jgi:type IV pilus assembly protein PilE
MILQMPPGAGGSFRQADYNPTINSIRTTMRTQLRVQKGFTLIELIIAIVIIGILASIAIPSYLESVMKSKRTQAQVAITGLAQALERNFTNTNTYATKPDSTSTVDASNQPTIYPAAVPPSGTAFYTLTIVIPAGGASYTISATPIAGGQMAGDKCGAFTYTSSGAQGVTGTAAVTDCWK